MLGDVLDIDNHEMIPTRLMAQNLGPVGAWVAAMLKARGVGPEVDPTTPSDPGASDVLPIDDKHVWATNGGERRAPFT